MVGQPPAVEGRVAKPEGQMEQVVKRLGDLRWTVMLWSGLNTALLIAVLGTVLLKV